MVLRDERRRDAIRRRFCESGGCAGGVAKGRRRCNQVCPNPNVLLP
jgi:hypothetical protein